MSTSTETHPANTVFEEYFSAPFTPTVDGVYTVTALATDPLSGTALITGTAFVDTTPPTASLDRSRFNHASYSLGTGLSLSGIASDTAGLLTAAAQLDFGGPVAPLALRLGATGAPAGYLNGQAVFTLTTWTATWWTLGRPPDNITATLKLALVDVSQNAVTVTFPITLDVAPPAIGDISLLANGQPMTVGQTYTDTALVTTATLPAISDGSGLESLYYGWTETLTATEGQLTAVGNPHIINPIPATFNVTDADGGKARYFHVIADDGNGNTSERVFGPYYQDTPAMPDYIGPTASAADYRGWQNSCTRLGTDQRLLGQSLAGAALNSAQSLYLTWDATRLHFAWKGANWGQDGELFIYLDTLPDTAGPTAVGTQGAYNPYASTTNSTVLLLPAQEWSRNPNGTPPTGAASVDVMHADYALWVKDATTAHLLRWNGSQWVDDGSLSALGGAYTLRTDGDRAYTDLVILFNKVGNPQNWAPPFAGKPAGMGVVALAVDGPSGPSHGLRLWSVLPYANPADSARGVANAPSPTDPHLLMLTNRYVVTLQTGAGLCFTPEANPQFYLSGTPNSFSYNGFDDATRLILPAPSLKPSAFAGLFVPPITTIFDNWVHNTYCPAHPTYGGCPVNKPPYPLSALVLLAPGAANNPPLLPGSRVTYTLAYLNPQSTALNTSAYLYTNGNQANPRTGVVFGGQSWVNNCAGWLALSLPPGSGQLVFTGTVQATGVATTTLDIGPSYTAGAYPTCGTVAGNGDAPAYRLTVQHTVDSQPPAFVGIDSSFTHVAGGTVSVPGTVTDLSPVSQITLEVTSPYGAVTTLACADSTPTDGQWSCPWNVNATTASMVNGFPFGLRARAVDAYGNVSGWSATQIVRIDLSGPTIQTPSLAVPAPFLLPTVGSTGGPLGPAAPAVATLTNWNNSQVIQLNGQAQDNNLIQMVQVCDGAGNNCADANTTTDQATLPPTAYNYTDAPGNPLASNGANVCGGGTTGLVRTFLVTDVFTVTSVQVGLRVAHPYRSDLSATLKGPDNTQATLFSFPRNVLAQNVNAFFTDQAVALLADDTGDHDLQAPYTSHRYRPRDALDAFQNRAAAGAWTLTVCDHDPVNDAGQYDDAALIFQPVPAALNTTANWSYSADVGGSDGQVYTWTVSAVDVSGNHTAVPFTLTVPVDNVAPVITATQTTQKMFINATATVLTGTASDANAVSSLWVVQIDPQGQQTVHNVQGGPAGWQYALTPAQGGAYVFAAYASDPAGNIASVSPFTLTVLQPLQIGQLVAPQTDVQPGGRVTYTLTVLNPNALDAGQNVVITSSLSQYLTPVSVAGATFANHQLTWPAATVAAQGSLTLTVVARMTDTLEISPTAPLTLGVNLAGASLVSQSGLTSSNLGPSQNNPVAFTVVGGP